jgi:hypothetical protein
MAGFRPERSFSSASGLGICPLTAVNQMRPTGDRNDAISP